MHVTAIENDDILRAIEAGTSDIDVLADKFGRRRDSMKRSMQRLAKAGVVVFEESDGHLELTDEGRSSLGPETLKPQALSGFVGIRHDQISPDPLNPRRDFGSAEFRIELEQLRQDILQNGLLQNLVVRELSGGIEVRDANGVRVPQYSLVSGERRWRAIGLAIVDGDLPEDHLIPVQIIKTDDVGHRLRALSENLQRRALNPVEEAQAFSYLVREGITTADLADRLSITQRNVQQRLQLLKLSDDELHRITLPKDDPNHLSLTDARAILQGKDPDEVKRTALAPPPAPTLAFAELSPEAELVLLEIYKRDRDDDGENRTLGSIPQNLGPQAELIGEGLIAISTYPAIVALTTPGRAWVEARCVLATLEERIFDGIRLTDDTPLERIAAEGAKYRTAWLNLPPPEPPEPPEPPLEDELALAALEIIKARKILKSAGLTSEKIEISPYSPKDLLSKLRAASLIYDGAGARFLDGRWYLSVGWAMNRRLKESGLDIDETPLDTLIDEVRQRLGYNRLVAYSNTWLAGPFEVTPGAQVALDKREAENARRIQENKERAAAADQLRADIYRLRKTGELLTPFDLKTRFADLCALAEIDLTNLDALDNYNDAHCQMALLALSIASGTWPKLDEDHDDGEEE